MIILNFPISANIYLETLMEHLNNIPKIDNNKFNRCQVTFFFNLDKNQNGEVPE